jgi:hypothetical protein
LKLDDAVKQRFRSWRHPVRKNQRGRCDHNPARPSTSNDSSRRRSRTTPLISPNAVQPSGRTPCAKREPSCCIACRRRSSHQTVGARPKHDAETIKIIAGSAGVHHFNGTAREFRTSSATWTRYASN